MISIIIPVYNVEKYLDNCLQSIISNENQAIEIMLVDDGSADNSLKKCKAYANEYDFIKVIAQKNKGAYYARKNGLMHSKGEYVWFVDSDDYIANGSIELIVSVIEKYSPQIIQFGYNEVNEQHEITRTVRMYGSNGLYNEQQIETCVLPSMFYRGGFHNFGVNPALWNKVFCRDYVIRYFNDINNSIYMGEDGLVTFKCYMNASSLYMLNDAFLYSYRLNDNSVSHTLHSRDFVKQNVALFSEWNQILAKYPKNKILKNSYSCYVFFLMWEAMVSTLNKILIQKMNKEQVNRELKAFQNSMEIPMIKDCVNSASFSCISIKKRFLFFLFALGQFRLIFLLWKTHKLFGG